MCRSLRWVSGCARNTNPNPRRLFRTRNSLEDRLRKLKEQLVHQPSIDEYLDASNRERTRALHTLAERLEKYGYDGDYLFTDMNRRMLAEDTLERRERDQQIVEAWERAQGIDKTQEIEGAKDRLLAMLGARSK